MDAMIVIDPCETRVLNTVLEDGETILKRQLGFLSSYGLENIHLVGDVGDLSVELEQQVKQANTDKNLYFHAYDKGVPFGNWLIEKILQHAEDGIIVLLEGAVCSRSMMDRIVHCEGSFFTVDKSFPLQAGKPKVSLEMNTVTCITDSTEGAGIFMLRPIWKLTHETAAAWAIVASKKTANTYYEALQCFQPILEQSAIKYVEGSFEPYKNLLQEPATYKKNIEEAHSVLFIDEVRGQKDVERIYKQYFVYEKEPVVHCGASQVLLLPAILHNHQVNKPMVIVDEKYSLLPVDALLRQYQIAHALFEVKASIVKEEDAKKLAEQYQIEKCDGIISIGNRTAIDMGKLLYRECLNNAEIPSVRRHIALPLLSALESSASSLIYVQSGNTSTQYMNGLLPQDVILDVNLSQPVDSHKALDCLYGALERAMTFMQIDNEEPKNPKQMARLEATCSFEMLLTALGQAWEDTRGKREIVLKACQMIGRAQSIIASLHQDHLPPKMNDLIDISGADVRIREDFIEILNQMQEDCVDATTKEDRKRFIDAKKCLNGFKKGYILNPLYEKRTFVYHKQNSVLLLPALLQKYNISKPMILCDDTYSRLPLATLLEHYKINHICIEARESIVTENDVHKAIEQYQSQNCDGIVSIGNRAAIDLGKLLYMQNANDVKKALLKRHIALPLLTALESPASSLVYMMKNDTTTTLYKTGILPQEVILDINLSQQINAHESLRILYIALELAMVFMQARNKKESYALMDSENEETLAEKGMGLAYKEAFSSFKMLLLALGKQWKDTWVNRDIVLRACQKLGRIQSVYAIDNCVQLPPTMNFHVGEMRGAQAHIQEKLTKVLMSVKEKYTNVETSAAKKNLRRVNRCLLGIEEGLLFGKGESADA